MANSQRYNHQLQTLSKSINVTGINAIEQEMPSFRIKKQGKARVDPYATLGDREETLEVRRKSFDKETLVIANALNKIKKVFYQFKHKHSKVNPNEKSPVKDSLNLNRNSQTESDKDLLI